MWYLIECRENVTGDLRLWWNPRGEGYTVNIDKAGRYSKEDAERICRDSNTDKMWTEAEATNKSFRAVRR